MQTYFLHKIDDSPITEYVDVVRCQSFEEHRSCMSPPTHTVIFITLDTRHKPIGKPFNRIYCEKHAELWVERGKEKNARFKVLASKVFDNL